MNSFVFEDGHAIGPHGNFTKGRSQSSATIAATHANRPARMTGWASPICKGPWVGIVEKVAVHWDEGRREKGPPPERTE